MKIIYNVISFLLLGFAWSSFGSPVGGSPPSNRISLEQAKAIATKKYSGVVKDGELEHEKGQWVYSFDIQGKKANIHEILVNAQSGKIVSESVEDPSQQAAEAVADKAEGYKAAK